MRVGVLDVGSNTAHLLVADAGDGMPLPVRAVKTKLRLAERVGPDRRLDRTAVSRLSAAVSGAVAQAREMGVQELFGYATAVVRDAPNRDEVLATVRRRSGLGLSVLSGIEEAQLTFLAARRWMGWRAGPLLLVDIGGGSVEVAYGQDVTTEVAVSLPLGAGRLTRERLLARLCGAAPRRRGPLVPRLLHRKDLRVQLARLASLSAAERARLPGISRPRAHQALAGALIAHTAMDLLGLRQMTVCPWALREGILLHRLESATWWRERSLNLGVRPPRPAAPDPVLADFVPIEAARDFEAARERSASAWTSPAPARPTARRPTCGTATAARRSSGRTRRDATWSAPTRTSASTSPATTRPTAPGSRSGPAPARPTRSGTRPP